MKIYDDRAAQQRTAKKDANVGHLIDWVIEHTHRTFYLSQAKDMHEAFSRIE